MSGRTLFSLFGKIALEGISDVNRDISEAEKKVKAFQRELGKLGISLSKAGSSLTKNLTAPLAAAGTAIGLLTLKTGEYASKLLSLSETTGMSTDSLQQWEAVARTAGVSSDNLLNTTLKLSNRLDEISKGSGSAAEAMDKLGISVTNSDGSLRSMEQLFPEILGELNKIENATERNNIAQSIFGGNIRDLAPVLALSADELANLRKEAQDTGKVMGNDALVNADKFRASVANLKAEFGLVSMKVAGSFIPILQGSVIPLIQDKVVPLVIGFANAIQGLAGWFNNLSPAVQNLVLILGAFVAAAGPALLITGKLIIAFKGMIGTVATLTGVFKGLWAVMLANPIGLVTTALAVFAGTVLYSKKKLEELDNQVMEVTAYNDRVKAHQEQHAILKKVIADYEKLRDTDKFDPAEYDRLNKAIDDNAIALTNLVRARNKQSQLDELGEENRRREIRGLKQLTVEEWERHKNTVAITDRQRRLNEEAAEKEAKLEEERRKRVEQRKADLASLLSQHNDAIDKILLSEMELLDKEEQREIDKATALKASEEELASIRLHFSLRREEIHNKEIEEIEKQIEAHKRELEEIEKIEADKLKAREDANQQWQDKLLKQSGDRLAILDAEYERELISAYKAGQDINAVVQYYENERKKIVDDINKEIAESDKRLANERNRYISVWVDSVVGAFNKLGSVMSMFSANEDKRLSREMKQRRSYINANIEDETERAKRLTALDEEEENRRLEIQRRQAKRDKAFGIFNTVIDTARAIVKTLADMGPIAGPVMATVIGGLGIAQTAAIASTPEPFYDGGLVRGSRDGIYAQLGERNQDEVVLPLERGTQEIADKIVNALNTQPTTALQPVYHTHVHVGTFIGDDKGIKELTRKIKPIMEREDRRTGRYT